MVKLNQDFIVRMMLMILMLGLIGKLMDIKPPVASSIK